MKNNKLMSDALWCDCDTDKERAEFFRSGRACETGIIAKAIEQEVAKVFKFRYDMCHDLKKMKRFLNEYS